MDACGAPQRNKTSIAASEFAARPPDASGQQTWGEEERRGRPGGAAELSTLDQKELVSALYSLQTVHTLRGQLHAVGQTHDSPGTESERFRTGHGTKI